MFIDRFGIQLRSIEKSDIELIRSWRNSDHVRKAMFYQSFISEDEQVRWFENINTSACYLMIIIDGTPVGICNVKEIDWPNRSGEAGVFIGEEDYLNSLKAVSAVIALMDTFFHQFRFTKLKASVRADRPELILFNEQLGYQIVSEDQEKVQLEITKDRFEVANQCNIKTLSKLNPESKIELSTFEKKLFQSQKVQ